MTTKKQPSQSESKTSRAEAPKKTVAELKKLNKEKEQLIYATTKVIVPLWFGQPSVPIRKAVNGPQMRPEAALCLLIHGANQAVNGHSSVTACEMALRPSGFDRFDANYIAFMGTASLRGAKLVKYAKKPMENEDTEAAKIVLTVKGQKLFDLAKGSILEPAP